MTYCPPITKPIRSAEPAFTNEPLTVDEAKRQCGVSADNRHYDQDFQRWIITARQQVEHDAEMVFYTGTFTWKITDWPYGDELAIPCVKPVSSISSITCVDSSGASQTWSSTEYALDTAGLVPLIKLNYGYLWPQHRADTNGITITFVAGYSALTDSRLEKYRAAVILKVRSFYRTAIGDDPTRDEEAYERLLGFAGLWSAA